MMGGSVARSLIEAVYLKNDKNFENTMEQFLSGNIPKDEMKMVVIEQEKSE
jgi:hypothetical protein